MSPSATLEPMTTYARDEAAKRCGCDRAYLDRLIGLGVLVTREVVEAAPDGGVSYTDVGPVELKGISGPVHLLAARRAG